MAADAMNQQDFERLLGRIYQETSSSNRKLDILFWSKGCISANQASRIIYAFATSADKLRALEIMQPRLCRMTCSEARDVIGAFNIHNDKVKALEHIKRYLSDHQSNEGREFILSSFPFENDKLRALAILRTDPATCPPYRIPPWMKEIIFTDVQSNMSEQIPAGGHQGYAALGGLFTQSYPLVPHLYGSVESQTNNRPRYNDVTAPAEAQMGASTARFMSGRHTYGYPQRQGYAFDQERSHSARQTFSTVDPADLAGMQYRSIGYPGESRRISIYY